MIIRYKPSRSGFSLVELLLTLVLILCLAAAAVFSFTAIYRSANLDEGMDRMQALIRFAQAEAATTGRKVRLEFEPAALGAVSTATETGTEAGQELRKIRVTWEPDYLTAPGVFETYTNKAWSEEMVNELVGVETVKPLGLGAAQAAASNMPTNEAVEVQISTDLASDPSESAEEFGASDFPAITFYPDGSSDSAEIVLASLNEDDQRRLAVRISGILGTVSSRPIASTPDESLESDENSGQAAVEEFNELFESAAPVVESPEF